MRAYRRHINEPLTAYVRSGMGLANVLTELTYPIIIPVCVVNMKTACVYYHMSKLNNVSTACVACSDYVFCLSGSVCRDTHNVIYYCVVFSAIETFVIISVTRKLYQNK